MSFRIGEIYRYSSYGRGEKPQKMLDGLPNYYYETYCTGEKSVAFQKGIHNIAKIVDCSGEIRIPAIIISSSPHKAGTDVTPWEDDYDPDHGHIRYYGDNKTNRKKAHESPGNELMLKMFKEHSSPDLKTRQNATPLIFFKRVRHGERDKGYLIFQGFGIIESVELITQFDPKLKNPYFTNYVFDLCVFSLANENEEFSWDWINDRRKRQLNAEQANKQCPKSWKTWVSEGSASLYKVRRTVSKKKITTSDEQKPEKGSKEEETLQLIYDYYDNSKHIFELLAMRVTQEIFEEEGIRFHPGWITNKSGDRGIDFVARLDISSDLAGMKIIVLGQAKCESPNTATNGLHIARTVARLKRGWLGVYVTTSYFSKNVQLEVMDDQYPIMLICGKKLAETVEKIIFKKGVSLEKFLNDLTSDYRTDNRRIEEILSI